MFKKNKKARVSTPNTYLRVFLIFFGICVIFAIFCFQYYKTLHETIKEESKNYLEEVTRQLGGNIDRIINDKYAVMYTMAESLKNIDNKGISEVSAMLQNQKKHWKYENIMLVDESGNAYDVNDSQVFLSLSDNVREDLLNGKQTMSIAQIINNKEYILFCIPLIDVQIEGVKMIAFAASYDPVSFDKVLSMDAFNEQAYSQIITKSGTVVTRTSSPHAIKSGYNIFSSLENAVFDNNYGFEKMKKEILEDKAGQESFTMDGVRRYIVYTPIQPDEWYLVTFIPTQVVNEKSDALLQTTLILCGMIVFAFATLSGILIYIFSNNKRRLERIAFVDEVTGGNTIQRFYQLSQEILDRNAGEGYALVYTNIEKFKVMNEQLGRQNCDAVLKFFSKFIQNVLSVDECMGRLTADNFCILIKFDTPNSIMERFKSWRAEAEKFVITNKTAWGIPSVEFGIYVIEDKTMGFPQIIDRAKLSLKEVLWTVDSKIHCAFYDDEVRRRIFREKFLEDRMEAALENNEFQMYLQPKVHLPDEKVGGAEALVRWVSRDEGMIYPNEFIPLFEKNGFIVKLDIWMFEQVCKSLHRWESEGKKLVKISVNCSRVHFKNPAFLEPYIRIAREYNIKNHQIEIELTESVVFENTDYLIEIINKIKEAGFACSMDDFGSGYSSLNLIQKIPVDTLKLDKIFFDVKENDFERAQAVVKNILSLAKALSMETVAEGVEMLDQVEMLKESGCDYIQGYIFSKPVKVDEFEQFAYGKDSKFARG